MENPGRKNPPRRSRKKETPAKKSPDTKNPPTRSRKQESAAEASPERKSPPKRSRKLENPGEASLERKSPHKRSRNKDSSAEESSPKHPRVEDASCPRSAKGEEESQSGGFKDTFEDEFHPDGSKVFNDPVHGHMEFHPLCVAIIDTPQFQRLRNIKQLAATYFVYSGAAHNRFEHSLGVGHLAGELLHELRTRQPNLNITWKDILCVQIAGLCHDLGHGPFSHLFEDRFVPETRPDLRWKHEQGSVDMFHYMYNQEANQLQKKFRKYGFSEREVTFIEELILGKHPRDGKPCYYMNEKVFLYEIVANKRNGVDVDKWDYFRRDCLQLGIFSSFDHTRFIKFARVIEVKGELQICVREKEAFDVYQMFHTRHSLHLKAYQHKSAYAIGVMLVEAMVQADEVINIPGDNGKWCKMSECIDSENMDAYTNLTDSVMNHILLTRDDRLKPAQQLLRDIERRHLYKCVGESTPCKEPLDEKTVEEEIKEACRKETVCESLPKSFKFVVQVVKLDFGKGKENPVDNMHFFSKHDTYKAEKVKPSEVSSFLPQVVFKEQIVRVFFRPTDNTETDAKSLEILEQGFEKWCKNKIGEKGMKHFRIPRSVSSAAQQDNQPP